jgi:hypothetical protein
MARAGGLKPVRPLKRETLMPDRLKPVLLILGLSGLAACHTDPFSIKPEVNVTLPEKAPADTAAPDDEESPETSEDASSR